MFQSIVVAIDGSMQANRALLIGAELATRTEARLGLVYVVDSNHMEIPDDLHDLRRMSKSEHLINPLLPRMLFDLELAPANLVKPLGVAAAETQRSLYQIGKYLVKQAQQDAKKAGANDIETSIEIGSPAERIIAFAKAQEADLIITGRHGFGPIKSLLLGSTSHKVTQLAVCSCMTVT